VVYVKMFTAFRRYCHFVVSSIRKEFRTRYARARLEFFWSVQHPLAVLFRRSYQVIDAKDRVRIAVVSTPRCGNTWLRMMLAICYDAEQIARHTPKEVDWANLPSGNLILQIHWRPTNDFVDKLKTLTASK